jgi:mannose-6-phosphate isomerase-like protein (cupin superfamily)
MIVRRPDETTRFVTSDLSRVVEVFHPDREALPAGMACSIAHARVAAGAATAPHTLATSTEVYWVLSGRGRMHVGDETADIGPGETVLIPPDSVQWIETLGDEELVFLCVVTPPWSAEDDRRR